MQSIFNQEGPLTECNFYRGTSLASYQDRVTKRWQEKASSIKRAYTLYSPLAVLALITLQTHFV